MDPSASRPLLEQCVVLAHVTEEEHKRLGGIFTHHEALYGRMLAAPVADLPKLGLERYEATGIELLVGE